MEGSKFDKAVARYRAHLTDIFRVTVDEPLLAAITKWQGPNNYIADNARVSTTDSDEMARLSASLTKRLDLAEDDDSLPDQISTVLAGYGTSNRDKFRVVIAYMITTQLGKRDAFVDPASDDSSSDPNDASTGNGGSDGQNNGQDDGANHEGDQKMPIVFIDARDSERRDTRRLDKMWKDLQARKEKNANLSKDEEATLELLTQLLEDPPNFALENTYVTLRQELSNVLVTKAFPRLKDGMIDEASIDDITREALLVAAVWGAVESEGIVTPGIEDGSLILNDNGVITGIKLEKPTARFGRVMTSAVAQVNSHLDLFRAVLQVMAEAPDVNTTGQLRAKDWLAVTRNLIASGVEFGMPGLQGRIRAAIEDRLSPTREKVTATAEIIIPDLEQHTAQEVQQVNLEAAQALYFAAMMDEARVFDCVDKLAELFQIGAVPLERSSVSEFLYRYIRQTPERISAYERRNQFARVFGAAVGDPDAAGALFRNFDDLWLRFVSAVSDWFRKQQVESLIASKGSFVPSQEQIRKSGLDLAANLSLYCYGGTWFVASELQKDISNYVDLLSSPEIKHLYGARDMWQVIDQISTLEFGRPVNTIRARTMANAGATIIAWLEKKSDALSQVGSILLNPVEISNPPRRTASNAINDPSDFDLLTACEQWLAVEGVAEDIVEVKSGASPSAVTQTAPVRIPPAAQNILGAFGFSHQDDPSGHANGHYANGRMN